MMAFDVASKRAVTALMKLNSHHIMKHSILLFTFLLLAVSFSYAATQTKQQQASSSSSYNTRTSRRERNLDHWDADTLAYYLGVDETTGKVSPSHVYPGYDAAVLFYAQWCQNCHAFAPSWDAIATHLKAGTVSSNLIMAVFDCELDTRHSRLCSMAGVQHYPTLLFIGDGEYHDSDVVSRTLLGKKRGSGPAGPSPIPHTVKFQGNWQYADSVLDWLRMMQGFSRWHQWTSTGILRHLRNGLLGFLRPKRFTKKANTKPASLPIGVPPPTTSASSSGTSSSSSSSPTSPSTSLLENQLKQSKQEAELMEKAAAHAGLLLDAILFPPRYENTTNDIYQVMNTTSAWEESFHNNNNPVHQVMRTCLMELSLDYCSRLSTQVTLEYLDELEAMNTTTTTTTTTDFPSMMEIEALLKQRIVDKEFYCGIMDECLAENFGLEKCKPPTCPLQEIGCRYVSACMDTTIQREYAVALGIIGEDEKEDFPPKQSQQAQQQQQQQEEETTTFKKKGSWGF